MKVIKENKYIFITFIASFIAIIALYVLNKVLPFGINSLLTVDFYYQYGPLSAELYDRITNFSSLLFSFNSGLGIPFFRNILNYLASPFNIILLLFKRENILTAFSVIIALKACFSSSSMAYYLKKTFKKNDIFICAFGILYGFSAYFAAYYWNLMWLDGMIMLPIICIGINKIIDDNNPYLYIISLTVMIISNYFIAYMICIFAVIYFLSYLIIKNKFSMKLFFKKMWQFLWGSLLAGGISAFAIIPFAYALKSISATGDKFVFTKLFNFNFYEVFPNGFTGVIPTIFSNREGAIPLPNIACGILSIVLTICFFFNKEINLKTKIIAIVVIAFFLFSFVFKPLDFIWHGFHVPNDLPYRYSFIYIFIISIISYYSIIKIRTTHPIFVILAFVMAFACLFIFKSLDFYNFNIEITTFIFIFLTSYLIIYLIFRFILIDQLRFGVFTTILVLAEVVIGININWNINHDSNIFMSDFQNYENIIKEINSVDKSFFRIERNSHKTLNDGSWYNYRGINAFSSVAYENTAVLMRRLGLGGNNINSYYYKPNTPILDMMLSLKYTLEYRKPNEFYSQFVSHDTSVYKFNYSLSPVYAVDKEILNWNINTNPFMVQSGFIEKTTGIKNIFKKVDPISIIDDHGQSLDYDGFYITHSDNTTAMTIKIPKQSDNIYIYIYNYKTNFFSINGHNYYVSANEPFILDAGKFDNEDITINIFYKDNDGTHTEFYAYLMDEPSFIQAFLKLKMNQLNIDTFSDTKIHGIISADNDQVVFTTISYDDGWTVFIDGKKTKTFPIGDALLGFDISEGTHEVELSYKPKGMIYGVLTSFASISITTFLMFRKKKKAKVEVVN